MKRRTPNGNARRRANPPLRAGALVDRGSTARAPRPSSVGRATGHIPRSLRDPQMFAWPEPVDADAVHEPEVEQAPTEKAAAPSESLAPERPDVAEGEVEQDAEGDVELGDVELGDDELRDDELRDDELRDDELRDDELRDDELRDDELRDDELRDDELRDLREVDPSDRAAVDEQAVDEQAVHEQAVDEQSVDEQSVDEQSVDEQSVDEQSTVEQSADEQAADEQSVDEQREQGVDEPHVGEDSRDVEQQRRGRVNVRLVAAAAVIVVLVGAVALYAARHQTGTNSPPAGVGAATGARPSASASGSQASPSTAAAIGANQVHALTWVAANLSKTSTVLADRTLAARLEARGFTAVRSSTSGPLPTYVMADPALRASATSNAVIARAVPIARFGAGEARVEVSAVLRVGAAQRAALLASDKADCVQAGTELASNSRLDLDDETRATLEAGGLDLRPAAFLALVSADRRVRVIGLPIAAAERAVGRPARTVTIAASGDLAAAIASMTSALAPQYAPTSITMTRSSITLTWAPTARAVQAVT